MKKTLLFLTVFTATLGWSQNVDDQKISFSYIQLPSTPIKGTTNYSIVIDHAKYQAANQDSLTVFETKINSAELLLTSWIEQKQKVDQAYLMEMAKWEKLTNAGTITPQPNKQPYPQMPMLKQEIPEPILTEEISAGTVDSKINLQGFTKGEGGAVITLAFDGIQNAMIVEKKTGTGATTKYEYTAQYSMPVRLTVEVPGQGIIVNENLNVGVQSVAMNKYDSKYDFEYWKITNLNSFWKTTQQNELNKILSQVDNLLNERCGFPKKTNSTEIYTVKKYKEHSYSDLIDAYTQAKSGYDVVYKDLSKKDAKAKLQKAITTWEKALGESNMIDDKARINDKVTALIYVNLAEAYLWMDDYDNADAYIQKAKLTSTAAGKYKREAEELESLMGYLKARKIANE